MKLEVLYLPAQLLVVVLHVFRGNGAVEDLQTAFKLRIVIAHYDVARELLHQIVTQIHLRVNNS